MNLNLGSQLIEIICQKPIKKAPKLLKFFGAFFIVVY